MHLSRVVDRALNQSPPSIPPLQLSEQIAQIKIQKDETLKQQEIMAAKVLLPILNPQFYMKREFN